MSGFGQRSKEHGRYIQVEKFYTKKNVTYLRRGKLALIKFSQAWVACLIAMGGGVSPYHMIVAAKTGIVGSVGVLATSYLPDAYRTTKSNMVFTFGTTFVGDIVVVPTHYGPVWMEALLTGLLAAFFTLMFHHTKKFINNVYQLH